MEYGHHPEQREWRTPKMEAFSRAADHHVRNEDAYFIAPDHMTAGVFDGVGGEPGGDHASRLAATTVFEKMAEVQKHAGKDEILWAVHEAFDDAHRQIQFAQKHDLEHPNMCTTGVLARVYFNGSERRVIIAHAGDSRAYLRHPDSRLEAVTLDDSLRLHEIAHAGGAYDERAARKSQDKLDNALSDDGLTEHEQRIFDNDDAPAQLIGYETYKAPHVKDILFPKDAKLLLASDGLQNLTRDEMAALWNTAASDPKWAAELLVEQARQKSLENNFRSQPDDMTALIIE